MAGPPCSMMVPASQSVHLRRSWRLEGTTSNYKTRLSNRIWKNFVSPLLISWAGFEHGCQGFSPKTDAKVLVPKRMLSFLLFGNLWEDVWNCLEMFFTEWFFSIFFGEVKEVVVRGHFINTVQDFPRSSQLSIKGFLLRCN